MTFIEIIPYLNEGYPVRRASYHPSFIVFKQIPASIDDVAPLKSVPNKVKSLMLRLGVGIDYDFQYIVYDFVTGLATDCMFDGEDINAPDWEIVPPDYNPYEGE